MEENNKFLDSLEHSYKLIKSEMRLSTEASIEELCKVLLLKLCFERKNNSRFLPFVDDLKANTEPVSSFYRRYYETYASHLGFIGWESQMLSKDVFWRICEGLSKSAFTDSNLSMYGSAFSAFLQKHYAGYLSEYSTPEKLNSFILEVLGYDKISNMVDPCCGLGGTLIEAAKKCKENIVLKGFDIYPRMANTAKLHMMMYGYGPDIVECADIMNGAQVCIIDQFDYIVAHLPQTHQAFSLAGRQYAFDKMLARTQEDFIIGQLLKILRPEGIAAIVVSDGYLEADKRYESRRWLYENAQVINITKFEGLKYEGGDNARPYNVVFLKKMRFPGSDVCSAAYIGVNDGVDKIKEVALSIKNDIYGIPNQNTKEAIRYFRLMEQRTWNITLLFLQEKMGNNYPIVPLRALMVHRRERVEIYDYEEYSQLTVRNKGLGVERRGEPVKGINLSKDAKYIAHRGQLIVSSLEASKGAIGIVPKELDYSVVTSNYYLFSIDSGRVDYDYLALVMSTEPVLNQMKVLNKHEYAMARITIEKILSVVIPLPDLDTQRRLSKMMMKKVKKVQNAQEELDLEQKKFMKEVFGE